MYGYHIVSDGLSTDSAHVLLNMNLSLTFIGILLLSTTPDFTDSKATIYSHNPIIFCSGILCYIYSKQAHL